MVCNAALVADACLASKRQSVQPDQSQRAREPAWEFDRAQEAGDEARRSVTARPIADSAATPAPDTGRARATGAPLSASRSASVAAN